MRRGTVLTHFFFWLFGLGAAPAFTAKPAQPLIVIDPGHGGNDLGATLRVSNEVRLEKQMTLLLAQEVASELQKRRVKAILTRRTDQSVDLPERTAMANRLKADLFVSIHMNAAPPGHEATAQGFETYILNNGTDRLSRRIAELENSVLSGSRADVIRSSPVSLILKDMILDANQSESKRLACLIQQSLVRAAPSPRSSKDRGVKQALFYVLIGADMPSVLVEAGFLNSPEDRANILYPDRRRRMAAAIAEAITTYQRTKNTRAALRTLSRCQVI